MTYTMFVLYYYHIEYCYYINIDLYALQVHIYILDYAYECTNLSGCTFHICTGVSVDMNETHFHEMYLDLHMVSDS